MWLRATNGSTSFHRPRFRKPRQRQGNSSSQVPGSHIFLSANKLGETSSSKELPTNPSGRLSKTASPCTAREADPLVCLHVKAHVGKPIPIQSQLNRKVFVINTYLEPSSVSKWSHLTPVPYKLPRSFGWPQPICIPLTTIKFWILRFMVAVPRIGATQLISSKNWAAYITILQTCHLTRISKQGSTTALKHEHTLISPM